LIVFIDALKYVQVAAYNKLFSLHLNAILLKGYVNSMWRVRSKCRMQFGKDQKRKNVCVWLFAYFE